MYLNSPVIILWQLLNINLVCKEAPQSLLTVSCPVLVSHHFVTGPVVRHFRPIWFNRMLPYDEKSITSPLVKGFPFSSV